MAVADLSLYLSLDAQGYGGVDINHHFNLSQFDLYLHLLSHDKDIYLSHLQSSRLKHKSSSSSSSSNSYPGGIYKNPRSLQNISIFSPHTSTHNLLTQSIPGSTVSLNLNKKSSAESEGSEYENMLKEYRNKLKNNDRGLIDPSSGTYGTTLKLNNPYNQIIFNMINKCLLM